MNTSSRPASERQTDESLTAQINSEDLTRQRHMNGIISLRTMGIEKCAILGILLAVLVGGTQSTAQGLAPSVQADLLRNKIYAQAKANDADGVMVSLDQYHKLVSDNNLAFPPALYWIEAKAAHDSADAKRALSALTQFLNVTDHGSSQYKEALALYPQYEQAVAASKILAEDSKRQALIARIPEVVAQIAESLVEVQGERFVCPKPTVNSKLHCSKAFSELRVAPFKVMKRCTPWLWWDVYVADTGRKSPHDDLRGRAGCLATVITSTVDLPKGTTNSYVPTSSDNIITAADVNGFVEWISAHTRSHWRLPTDAEFELMYQRSVGSDKGQDPFPDLGTSVCSSFYNNFQTSTWERTCNSRISELTNNCLPTNVDSGAPNVEESGPSVCEGKRLITVSLKVNRTTAIDKKGRITNLESYSIDRGWYQDLSKPGSYLDRQYSETIEVQFHMVSEQ
jgi:formylglycine-generating enzyme required for sulfatase activity